MPQKKDVLAQAIDNLRGMVGMSPGEDTEEPIREPAGRMDDVVTEDISNIQFPKVPAQELRQQQMDKSIRDIKQREYNKEMRESLPSDLVMRGGREIAALKLGPETKEATEKFFKPEVKSLDRSRKDLEKTLEVVKKESNTEEEKKQLDQESKGYISSALDLIKEAPSGKNVLGEELLRIASIQNLKAIDDQNRRTQELLDASGKPIFGKEDTAKVAILALAPIVAGYLVDGARGGAIGAQAGQLGVAKFEEQKKEQLSRQLNALEKSTKITGSMLARNLQAAQTAASLGRTEGNIEVSKLNAQVNIIRELLSINQKKRETLEARAKQGLLSQVELQKEKDRLDVEDANNYQKYQNLLLDISKADAGLKKAEKEKGESDLGFGFAMDPRKKWTPKDREKAQPLIASYGDVDAAFRDLISEVRGSTLKSLTRWSDAGETLQRRAASLKEALIAYTKRGASLTKNEEALVNAFSLSGDLTEKFKLATNPQQLADRLEGVLQGLKNRTASKVRTYNVILSEGAEAPGPELRPRVAVPRAGQISVPVATRPEDLEVRLTREQYDAMTDQQKIQYGNAKTAREKREILQKVRTK